MTTDNPENRLAHQNRLSFESTAHILRQLFDELKRQRVTGDGNTDNRQSDNARQQNDRNVIGGGGSDFSLTDSLVQLRQPKKEEAKREYGPYPNGARVEVGAQSNLIYKWQAGDNGYDFTYRMGDKGQRELDTMTINFKDYSKNPKGDARKIVMVAKSPGGKYGETELVVTQSPSGELEKLTYSVFLQGRFSVLEDGVLRYRFTGEAIGGKRYPPGEGGYIHNGRGLIVAIDRDLQHAVKGWPPASEPTSVRKPVLPKGAEALFEHAVRRMDMINQGRMPDHFRTLSKKTDQEIQDLFLQELQEIQKDRAQKARQRR